MRRAAAAAALTLAACGHAPHHVRTAPPAPLAADDGLRHALAAASRSRPPAPAPPAPAVRRAPTRRVPPTRGVGGRVPSGDVWGRLAACESGGNWHINTGNGYYGGLQENLDFWRSYGPRHTDPKTGRSVLDAPRPDLASPEQQIAAAERARRVRGFSPWPSCSRKLGLAS
jgi:resuscitation-promoting factor RpfB